MLKRTEGYLLPEFLRGPMIFGCSMTQVHTAVSVTCGAAWTRLRYCTKRSRDNQEGEREVGHLAYEALLTPLRRLNKNISSCFSARILFQAEQKPVAIRHAKPEIKSLLLSSVTLGEARALVEFPRLPCPLSAATWAWPASYITPVPVTTRLSAFSFLVFEV